MEFSDYNQFFKFLEENQDILSKYAYLRDFYNSVVSVWSCSCKRTQRVAIAKSKYNMVACILKDDEEARDDFKKAVDNEQILIYNDGELLIEF